MNKLKELYTLALYRLKIKKIIDKYCKSYNVYTKNELIANDRWVEIFDKNSQCFSKYMSDEFEPRYRVIMGKDK